MSLSINVSKIPLALYIHIPWCVKKCPYCDFNSHTLPVDDSSLSSQIASQAATADNKALTDDHFTVYVEALIEDINSQLPLIQGREITSIFIGGGTPSLLPIKQYQRLFDHLKSVLPLASDLEVTMEANPGTLEHAPFEEYLKVGINRLSMGVQSFSDTKLESLGRIHNANQAQLATQAAKKAGFKRVNIDLMHGLPNQTLAEALYDIEQAHQAGATHISWYQLTIEPNTVFYRNTPVLPDDNDLADIEEQGSALLTQLGYKNYEVSAWVGDQDDQCRHNVNYWQFGDYLAIGAGAHGKITLMEEGIYPEFERGIYRFSKTRLPKDYMNYEGFPKVVGFSPIADEDLSGEFMMNALRLSCGVPLDLYNDRTGLSAAEITPIIERLQQQGLLVNKADLIQPTALGRRYLNQVLQAFL
ncbi:radical SAM family heme chaperone HemW [Psychrobacter piechaudii]|uniref:Heme chaperone HemW n=1 Tax=Psychrobacter piechaudii TaxID=1945521 RepID=A0A1R4GUX0_9GAMM|nr:radical SAM family heme chaperone HemW [Psychrobacter piechaudii]SJM71885.1 Oxygen-independent coproporphyrinogen-III oxidase 1 [Psychrobacter piechaudii]